MGSKRYESVLQEPIITVFKKKIPKVKVMKLHESRNTDDTCIVVHAV